MSVSLFRFVLVAITITVLATCFRAPRQFKSRDLSDFIRKHLRRMSDKVQEAECALDVRDIRCNRRSFYRSYDGSCNNILIPSRGQALRPHARMLQPEYSENDGMRNMGKSGELPSTRKVSTTVFSAAQQSDRSHKITNMVWLWGQFLDHDITLTPQNPQVDCCGGDKSPTCIPIQIPNDDPFWGPSGRTCMNMVRSTSMESSCGLRGREQINAITSFVDASNVYGSSEEAADSLRSFSGGKLKTSAGGHLPPDEHGAECLLPANEPIRKCFLAGDVRSTEWAGLASFHTLFVQLHNVIAGVFYNKLDATKLTAKTRDTIAYQETRRVVAALAQVITYHDFLPIILGRNHMSEYSLSIPSRRYRYSSRINPAITNVFATAAYRFGHSLITDAVSGYSVNYQPTSPQVKLTDMFFQPSSYYNLGQNNLLRGLCSEAGNKVDNKFSGEILHRLFEKNMGGLGLDLPALNTQRGRDHGLPSYNKWRQYCGLKSITSFTNMPDHSEEVAAKLGQAYAHPDDMDLFPPAITEKPVEGGLVGPTFACILGQQFQRLKYGDRFWFENKRGVYKFSKKQLQQLNSMSLAKVVCMTTNSEYIPKDVFDMTSPKVHCDSMPGLDLDDWLKLSLSSLHRMSITNPELFDADDKLRKGRRSKLFVFGRIPLKHKRG